MTIEEAKTASFNELAGYIQRNCFNCCCSREECYCDGDCVNQIAFDRLKEAFEKQIPKKPKYKLHLEAFERYVGQCSNCGLGMNSRMNYCEYCGQKIDWSEE